MLLWIPVKQSEIFSSACILWACLSWPVPPRYLGVFAVSTPGCYRETGGEKGFFHSWLYKCRRSAQAGLLQWWGAISRVFFQMLYAYTPPSAKLSSETNTFFLATCCTICVLDAVHHSFNKTFAPIILYGWLFIVGRDGPCFVCCPPQ